MLSLHQPWASLLARGAVRFTVCEAPTAYRGTIAIHASDAIDPVIADRLESDPEFTERLSARGLGTLHDVEALPRNAIVGVAVLADVWSMDTLGDVATEDDAILIGDVIETTVFWELVEAVEIATIADPVLAERAITNSDTAEADDAESEEAESNDAESDTAESDIVAPVRLSEPMPEELADAVEDAAKLAGAQFDADGLVFWPVSPTPSLASLIGDDAIGDREITRRVWEYVIEQDLQDPEDNAYVYLDDALRSALNTDADGMTTIEFGECINAQISARQA